MSPLLPHHMPGKPGGPAPAASSSGPCSAYSYQLDGTQNGWCRAPYSTPLPVRGGGPPDTPALPVRVREPCSAQLLLPVSPSLPAAIEAVLSLSGRESHGST